MSWQLIYGSHTSGILLSVWQVFNQVIAGKKAPDGWQKSRTLIPTTARIHPLRLLSHSVEVFEQILDRRLREIVKLSDNQCDFVAGCTTLDAIHAPRLLVKKHREEVGPLGD
ncbi:unnamed protein product [Heligmosomoides polygyrus]|uniref:Reverse transcriptase domain-containing protein n=1 Tax=Heligmosomoides polygyrus TaxID=6339 RepID=A0A183FAZ9_HELPZ|nr:unnamed protein product [Heligmosomoides polygyrus]